MRLFIVIICILILSACASGPGKGSSSPFVESLHICQGMSVSNAPAHSSNGQIKKYQSIQQVRGVRLMTSPVRACLSSAYGPRRGGAGNRHKGIDLFTRVSAPVYAAGDGVVTFVGNQRGYGRLVEIRHSKSVKTRYAHLSTYTDGLRKGQRLRQGDLIGQTGKSGNATAVHLHYEIVVNDKQIDPLKF